MLYSIHVRAIASSLNLFFRTSIVFFYIMIEYNVRYFSLCWMPWRFLVFQMGAPCHSATERSVQSAMIIRHWNVVIDMSCPPWLLAQLTFYTRCHRVGSHSERLTPRRITPSVSLVERRAGRLVDSLVEALFNKSFPETSQPIVLQIK